MTMEDTTPEMILALWEKSNGSLSNKWKSQFLDQEVVFQLVLFPLSWVEQVFSFTPKLNEALNLLEKEHEKFEAKRLRDPDNWKWNEDPGDFRFTKTGVPPFLN
jgi:hypothetical protein